MKKTLAKNFTPVKAAHHTPPYRIHRYFARRPWNLFRELIESLTNEGQTVLDPFCGGGVTVYEGVTSNRKVIASDLNPLSVFIVKNMFHKKMTELIRMDYERIISKLEPIVAETFATNCPHCGTKDMAGWYELVHTCNCDLCGSEIILSDENKIRNGLYKCQNSKCTSPGVIVARQPRQKPIYLSLSGRCTTCKKAYSIPMDEKLAAKNLRGIKKLQTIVKDQGIKVLSETIPLDWDRQKEDLLEAKGFMGFEDLFTKKNLLINSILLDFIKNNHSDKESYEILRFIFSDSLRDTNIMSFTNKNWQNGAPTTWAKHAYWIPPQFCEVNPLKAIQRSFGSMKKTIDFNSESGYEMKLASQYSDLKKSSNLLIKRGVVRDLNLPAGSIDIVITDPPYGSNVQYLELSHFWHMWNQDLYEGGSLDFSEEAIVNRKQNFLKAKGYKDYEDNLFSVFSECQRVLKKDGLMVMTFNNKDLRAWIALLISIFRSGFHFEADGITFQDGVANYKQTAHTKAKGSPYGDFVYQFVNKSHPNKDNITAKGREELVIYIRERINNAVAKYQAASVDRNVILIELFNEIVPEIEVFVKLSSQDEVVNDLYEAFCSGHLELLYA